MKTQLKEFRGEVFATVYLYIPPCNPVGLLITIDGKVYKIIDAVFMAFDKIASNDEATATMTVVEIPAL